MNIKSFFLAALLFVSTFLGAQNHLDYSYTLDALSYSIPGYENEEFYFKAHLYPVFHSHSNDSILNHLNGLFEEELILPKSAQLKERLVAVKIDNLMSDRQVLEMLMARIGLLNESTDDLDYLLNVRTDRIDFPDNRNTVFNYRFKRETSANPEHVTIDKKFTVYDWTSGVQILAGDLGDKKLVKCIQDATKSIEFSVENCDGETSFQRWEKEVGCETPVGKYSEDEVTFYMYSSDKPCEHVNEFPVEVEVLSECFKNDKPCN
jgi:hypothetical protein